MTPNQRKEVLNKTGGLCHICGSKLKNKKWHVDHVKPKKRGGNNDPSNYLAACNDCNRMKWHRDPKVFRKIIELGLYAHREIKNDTRLGKELYQLRAKRRKANEKRRVAAK